MRRRIIRTMPLISLFMFLLFMFALNDYVARHFIFGMLFFLLIPLSWLLDERNFWKRLRRSMPLVAVWLFFFTWFGFDKPGWAWAFFVLIPLRDLLFWGRINLRKFVPIAAIIAFLIIGLTTQRWHPAWLVFILIPIVNGLFFPYGSRYIHINRTGEGTEKRRSERWDDDNDFDF